VDPQAFYYFFSTIPQVLAGAIVLLGALVLYNVGRKCNSKFFAALINSCPFVRRALVDCEKIALKTRATAIQS
jgi:hypothetical protein